MAITFRGAGAVSSEAAGDTTSDVAYPSGIQANDLLVLVICNNSSTTSPTLPSGWTTTGVDTLSGGSTPRTWMAYKKATGSESGVLTVTTGGTVNRSWQMLAFAGVDQTTPIDVAATTFSSSTATTAYNITGATTTKTGVCIVYGGCANNATGTFSPPTVPATFTETADLATLSPHITAGYLIWSGSGATGTINLVSSASIRGCAGAIFLRPAATGQTLNINVDESAGITDQLIKYRTLVREEIAAISDSLTNTEGASWGGLNTVGATWNGISTSTWDNIRFVSVKNIDAQDTAGITDTFAKTQREEYVENMGLVDAFYETRRKEFVDSLGPTDTFAKSRLKSITDAMGLTDTVGKSLRKELTDALGITDAALMQKVRLLALQDNISLTDALAKIKTELFQDSIGVTDALTRSRSRALQDSIGITDSSTVAKSRFQSFLDSIGITDSTSRSITKGLQDTAGTTDSIAKSQRKGTEETAGLSDSFVANIPGKFQAFLDAIGITDSTAIQKQVPKTFTDPMDVLDAMEKRYSKGFIDFLNMTDQKFISQQDVKTDAMGVTDSFTMQKSKGLSLSSLVNIADTIALKIKKGFQSLVGITDSVSGLGKEPKVMGTSVVDQKRIIIGSTLGITEPTLSAVSINDLLHSYWSTDFPIGHVYDGSESGLPVVPYSTMDHFTRVQATEGVDLDYIMSVI